jgi:hypothetical protein
MSKYLTNGLLHPSKRLFLQWRGYPEGKNSFVKQSKLQPPGNSVHSCDMCIGVFLRIWMVFLCTAERIHSPLTKHTRPLLTTCVLVLTFFKVILVLYEQFNELSSSLGSRYLYGIGCIPSGVKVKFMGKNRRFLHNWW